MIYDIISYNRIVYPVVLYIYIYIYIFICHSSGTGIQHVGQTWPRFGRGGTGFKMAHKTWAILFGCPVSIGHAGKRHSAQRQKLTYFEL